MTDSIFPLAGRYEPEPFDDGCVDGTVASKYSEATKASAVQQAVEGRPHKSVAESFGISVTTLRRWLKEHSSIPAEQPPRLIILDSEDIHGKLERILCNEGFAPVLDRLRNHSLSAGSPEDAAWLGGAWLFELPVRGLQRLLNLIERSGKDIPVVCLADGFAPDCGVAFDYEVVSPAAGDTARLLESALSRLHARLRQREQLRDCQQHFEQLRHCCLRAFDCSDKPIAIVRPGGHIYANPAYLRLFGHAEFAALQDIALDALIAEQDSAALRQPFAAVLDTGRAVALDMNLRMGVRVRAELERFPGSSQSVQVILLPYVQAFAQHATEPAPVALTEARPDQDADGEQAVWEQRIRRALRERHLFSIVYQPIVHLGGAAEASYEALLRLHDEQGGEYLPASFLPAAERAGLMGVVDQWVIRQAARQVQSEWAAGRTVRIFVNLSRETLLNADFNAWFTRLLEHVRIAPEAFVLEVPEAVLMSYLPQCRATLRALRALGCGIALDHFGGGADAFALLQDAEVDYLKFDASLSRGLTDHRENPLRLQELIKRARALHIQTIVGRVQDARSVALLWQTGVDYVQGYFLQQPSKALDYDFVNGDYEVTTSNPAVF